MSEKNRGLILGIILSLITIIIASFFSKPKEIEFFAVVLMGIAAVYFGYAFLSGGAKEIIIEVTNITLFFILILAGLWINPLVLVIGYFWHGIWDAIHRRESQIVKTKVPEWYIYFCMIYDWIIGAFILIRLI
ncbi:MAG: DUF6010 family protein [Candidatus Paceibacterota bacterium]|jgi:ABC-type transport system involved in cytochrome bd biosynthesis fused ATPase/permease subunit